MFFALSIPGGSKQLNKSEVMSHGSTENNSLWCPVFSREDYNAVFSRLWLEYYRVTSLSYVPQQVKFSPAWQPSAKT